MTLELNYHGIRGHESMLKDTVRCEAFRKALAEVVTPGCAVLDVGAGTGLLSIFAAQAGARVVYAVERTSIASLARVIVDQNGFGDCIRVLRDDLENVTLPEKVDVIVSEWLGGYALDENLLPVVALARDRWLKPGGSMLPARVTSMLVPAFDAAHQQDIDFWRSYPYGVDLDAVGGIRARESYNARHERSPERMPCLPRAMWTIDSRTVPLAEVGSPLEACLDFAVRDDGTINALAAWFDATLSPGVRLGNGPDEPETHWGRSVFPIGEAVQLRRGDVVHVRFVHEPRGKGESRAVWEVEVNGYGFQSSDATVLT
jgi:type I protein arginine methyltransferase